MTEEGKGWLTISTDGFASMNAARPAEHLLKELVQNALDSLSRDQNGKVRLDYSHDGHWFEVTCSDNGSGIEDLTDLRVVYLTHKIDSHIKRGRFGRGFKEVLCISEQARVCSGCHQLEFLRKNGERITRMSKQPVAVSGTHVHMYMPWPAQITTQLDLYFSRFLVPPFAELYVNDCRILPRQIEHEISASLSTEIYEAETQSWKRPKRRTTIQLVRTQPDETPMIYEMGIPIAALEWSVPFHCDIQQRVPMNPNRDAVASGYELQLHVACLPALLDCMDANAIKQDWVGRAGRRCASEVQKRILSLAFGNNIARSVPRMGSRHFDEDARELGVQVIHTVQTSGGFREMLREFVPSAKDLVREDEQAKALKACTEGFAISAATRADDQRHQWMERQGGRERVQRCLEFAVWFCQKLVNSCKGYQLPVTAQLTLNTDPRSKLYAHWNEDNVLTLALDQDCFWHTPLGPESLEVLIHEAAHAMNMHHGLEFRKELERLAGVAACLMLERSNEIHSRFADLINTTPQT